MKLDQFSRRLLAAFVLVLLSVPALPAQIAQAANVSWTETSLNSVSCANGATNFTMQLSNVTFPTTLRFRTLVDAGSIRYMDEDAGNPGHNGTYGWSLYYDNSGGPATNAWPIPSNTPITVQFMLIDGVGGPAVYISEVHINKCNSGTLMNTFQDVPAGYWAGSWIYRLYAAGITSGCSTSPLLYCPDQFVTRSQMAKFLELGIHGAGYTPPAGTGSVFADVPISYWAVSWIEKLFADGVTSGCVLSPLQYCPDVFVTRAQMAKFLLVAEHGAGYIPPAVGGSTGFNDVSTGY
jgi:hypothetical protein